MMARTLAQEYLDRNLAIGDRLVIGEEHLAEASASKSALDQIVAKAIADRNHGDPFTVVSAPCASLIGTSPTLFGMGYSSVSPNSPPCSVLGWPPSWARRAISGQLCTRPL